MTLRKIVKVTILYSKKKSFCLTENTWFINSKFAKKQDEKGEKKEPQWWLLLM